MAYKRLNLKNGTVLDESHIEHIEEGIENAEKTAGTPGKSAYEYAQEAGYTGTEEEFAAKMSEELPAALPNPHALTINGTRYDGSEAVDLTIEGGSGAFYVVAIEGDADNGYRIAGALKEGYGFIECSFNDVANWLAGGDTVLCAYEEIAYPLVTFLPDGGLMFGTTIIGGDAAVAVYITLLPDGTATVDLAETELGGGPSGDVEIPETLPNPYGLTFENEAGTKLFTYDGSSAHSVTLPNFLPNPEPLFINGQLYDGTEAVDVTIGSMSFNVQDNGDGTYTASADFQTILSALENTTVTVLMQGESYTTVSVFQLSGAEMTPDETGEDISSMTLTFAHEEGSTRHLLHFHMDDTVTYEVIADSSGGGVSEEAVSAIIAAEKNSVIAYGAKGDGVTDDTKAFQDALAANRTVTIPGGTYVLSDTLVIRENCGLTLSQDTILKFTKTNGNCIEMRGSAVLRGNYAVLVAPYGLTGKVICADTLQDGYGHASIPPYEQNDPQWKRQRFVYDVNIIMPNSDGYNRPLADGVCSGTAVYMSATNQSGREDDVTFIWGAVMSGVRIAGGFAYGIHAKNFNSGWNHDMRIEAVIEGCEVGVELDHCNGAHLNVTVQPNTTNPGGAKYVKQGVVLRNSRYVDMMRSRVWDWQVARNDSEEFKHIALYGNCSGLLLDDFLVTEHPETDIRNEIYTDTPSNFDTMTILQEPANKWFKSIDNAPYFNNGVTNRKLMLATDKFSAEQAEFIKSADGYYTYEENFTNLVTGFQNGYYLNASGGLTSDGDGKYTTTDFIPVDGAAAHTYRIGGKGISWKDAYNQCRIAWYDANKTLKGSVMSWDKIGSSIYYPQWVEDETVSAAFSTSADNAAPTGAAYFRITAKGDGADLIVTMDEKQDYNAIWHGEPKRLDESIYAQNTFLKSPNGTGFRLIVRDDGTLATEPME